MIKLEKATMTAAIERAKAVRPRVRRIADRAYSVTSSDKQSVYTGASSSPMVTSWPSAIAKPAKRINSAFISPPPPSTSPSIQPTTSQPRKLHKRRSRRSSRLSQSSRQ